MKTLALPFMLLALLLASGCTPEGPRCINPGADWTIYVANRHDLTREFIARGGDYIPNAQVQHGFTDRVLKQIWVVGRPDDAEVIRALIHEREFHGPDNFAARVWTPCFDVMYADADPQAVAAALALQEARKATK